MTIEEAILRLGNILNSDDDFGKENREAMNLGIEALKRLKDLREHRKFDYLGQLPGETEE